MNTIEKKRVYSGIRATGELHLGNYLGAIKGMITLQEEYDCIFSMVDLHAITTPYIPSELSTNITAGILTYLAYGIDPNKALLEVQSTIPEHVELAYLLSTIYPIARLEDLPTYKEKRQQHPKYVNMGLLYYPILMAADILLYKADLVPVGIDQEPHLEVAREIARKFNAMFGDTFPEPHRFKTQGEYVPSLKGEGKMSKSVKGSYIMLTDDQKTIQEKIAGMPTDTGTQGGSVPTKGNIASLFSLMRLFMDKDLCNKFVHDYETGSIRYSQVKTLLAQAIYDDITPFQQKRIYLENHPEEVAVILEKSRKECKHRAQKTIQEVKKKMGLPLVTE